MTMEKGTNVISHCLAVVDVMKQQGMGRKRTVTVQYNSRGAGPYGQFAVKAGGKVYQHTGCHNACGIYHFEEEREPRTVKSYQNC
jgi:hypothetical protein